MIDKVIKFAEGDERVRWVLLNGSRADDSVVPDPYQDYDLELGVRDLSTFLIDEAWLGQFGEILIMQKPEAMDLFPPSLGGRFTFLIQFVDGTRLDLMLTPVEGDYSFMLPSIILLDKDCLIDDSCFTVRRNDVHVLNCVNEFLWLSFYVVKGIKRNQLVYAMDHLDGMRKMVLLMYSWKLDVMPGQSYKHLEAKLTVDKVDLLRKSYNSDDILQSMMVLFDLFEDASMPFEYDREQFGSVRGTHVESMV